MAVQRRSDKFVFWCVGFHSICCSCVGHRLGFLQHVVKVCEPDSVTLKMAAV